MASILCLLVFCFSIVYGFPSAKQIPLFTENSMPFEDSAIPPNEFDLGCSSHEHWDNCYSHCEHNCSNWGIRIPCDKTCVPGCVCDEGLVRGPNNDCIWPMSCSNLQVLFGKAQSLELDESHTCPPEEHWDMCKADCQRTCANEDRDLNCPQVCVSGCVCNEGFVRGHDGHCIPLSQCRFSDVESTEIVYKCPKHQHWDRCNALCGTHCPDVKESFPCLPFCVSGCVCDAGYVWGPDEDCILPTQCTSSDELNAETDDFCPPNEEFSPCLAHCQRNCSNWSDPTVPCFKACVSGCICKNGMVRGPHGNCMHTRQCPSRETLESTPGLMGEIECPIDEHFDNCAAHCQKNCSTFDQIKSCPDMCIPGCICDEGYVRGPTGRCILFEKCPSNDEILVQKNKDIITCPEGEHQSNHYEALPNSDKYCSIFSRFMVPCPPSFLKGCICNEGLVRGPDNKCIEKRLHPDANELEFMHETSVECEENEWLDMHGELGKMTEDEIESHHADISPPSIESMKNVFDEGETKQITYDPLSPELLSEPKKSSHENYGSSNPENEEEVLPPSDEASDSVVADNNFRACPDNISCTKWCNEKGHLQGLCIGRRFDHCICF